MRWVENDVSTPAARDAHVAQAIDTLIADGDAVLGLSGLTLLELRAAISQDWRSPNPDKVAFDATWADRSNLRLMEQVSTGRFVVVPVPPRAPEHAATLFDLATSEHQIALGTWDAIHLIAASAWGHRERQIVRLYTCDDGFHRFVGYYVEFEQFVEVVDMNPQGN